jgi:hypothetical protein
MADQWYYACQGQQVGPVSPEQLRQAAATGQLPATGLVWKQGMADWVPAQKVRGLFPSAVPTSPDTPPPLPTAIAALPQAAPVSTPAQPIAEQPPRQSLAAPPGGIPKASSTQRDQIVGGIAILVIVLMIVGGIRSCSGILGGPEHPKLAAFHQVVAKWNNVPDELAGDKADRKWREELDALIKKFDETPLDVKKDPEVAKSIIKEYQDTIGAKTVARYSEYHALLLDQQMQQLVSKLRERDD